MQAFEPNTSGAFIFNLLLGLEPEVFYLGAISPHGARTQEGILDKVECTSASPPKGCFGKLPQMAYPPTKRYDFSLLYIAADLI